MKKRRQISFFLLAIFIVSGVAIVGWFNFFNKKVSAAWFDDNWGYRQTVAVTNSGSAQTDFQISITLDTATLVTAGKMQSDCDDLRVTDSVGDVLPIFIEKAPTANTCNQSATVIWTKLASIPTTETTVYVYYGNPTAVNAQNGAAVFEFFDDGSNINNWTQAGTVSQDGTTGSAAPSYKINGTNGSYIYKDVSLTTSRAVDYDIYESNFNLSDFFYLVDSSGAGQHMRVETRSCCSSGPAAASSWTSWSIPAGGTYVSALTWHKASIVIGATTASMTIDGSAQGSAYTFTNNGGYIGLIGDAANAAYYSWFDNIRVRKSATTAPSAGTPASEEKSNGPIGAWRFDEGQGTAANDSSQNGNLGTLSGTTKPTWQSEDLCTSGRCLFFDGSTSYVDLGTGTTLNTTTGNLTLAAWIRTTQTTEGHIISRGSGGTTNALAFRIGSNAPGQLDCRVSTATQALSRRTVNDGKWHYVVCSVNRTGMANLYVDGVIEASVDVSGVSGNSITDSNWGVGVENLASKAHYFSGFIDEVKIYKYARSAAQVKLDYLNSAINKGAGATLGSNISNLNGSLSNGLVGYWKLNESSSTRADSSGNGYTLSDWNTVTASQGKFGNAGQFTRANSESLYVADNANLSVTGDYTISGWFYQDSATTGDRCIICKGDVINNKREFYVIRATNGTLSFYLATDGSTMTNVNSSEFSNTASAWNFVVAWYDSKAKTINIQVNGGKVDSVAFSATPYETDSQFMIGGGGNTAGTALSFFDGRIDDVRIYKRVLSNSERQALYNFAPGPDAYWPMEESQGTRTDIVGGLALSVAAGNVYSKPGKFGKGAYFPNTAGDYLSKTDDATLSMGNMDFTVEAWVYFDNKGDHRSFISKGTANTTVGLEYYLMYDVTADRFSWKISNGTTATTVNDTALGSPTAGTWYHVAGWYDSTNDLSGLTINGSFTTTASNTTGSQDTAGSFYVGAVPTGASHHGGVIDEVRVYRYLRSPKQIVADMNGGHPAPGSPVGSQLGYWKFDEGQGTTAYDSGISPNNGVLEGMSSPASVGISGWNPHGKFNKALSFDGSNDDVNFGDLSYTESASTLTWSFWVNPRTLATQKCLWCKYNNAATQRSWAIGTDAVDSSILRVTLPTITTEADGTTMAQTPTGTLVNGVWKHVSVVYDGTQIGNANRLKIYVNGVLQNLAYTGTIPASTLATTSNAVAGESSDGSRNYTGNLDEMKIYGGALTQSEVLVDYNRGKATSLGSLGVSTSDGKTASNSASAAYCVPGDTSSCNAPVLEFFLEARQGTSALDSSGNANTGTINGNPLWGVGKIGSGLILDGTGDYINSVHNGMNKDMGTVTMWVKDAFASSDTSAERFYFDSDGTHHAFYKSTLANRVEMYIDGRSIAYKAVWGANEWHHLAFVWNKTGNVQIVYFDGKPAEVIPGAGTWGSTALGTNIYFGADNSPGGRAFNGTMDQMRVYDYVLTAAQIAYEYNRGLPQSHWKFDECSGSTAQDSVGTVSGTLSGTVGDCITTAGGRYDGRNGRYNYGLSIAAASEVSNVSSAVSYPFSVPVNNNVSWGGWFKPTNFTGSPVLIDKGNTFKLSTDTSGNAICAIYTSGAYTPTTASGTTLSTSDWNHVLCTYDGINIKTYINGKLSASVNNTGGIPVGSSNLVLGQTTGGANQYTGLADDIKIWSYPLTSYQTLIEFNQGSAVRFGPSQGTP